MPRIFNFSAGPAVLPEPVLAEAKDDLTDYKGCGMSVMELSHRGPEFMDIIARAEADLRALLSIPDSYDVLFLQGGASGQFAAIPLNLTAKKEDVVDYVVTGSWSKKAAEEAGKYATVNIAAKGDNKSIPPPESWALTPGAKYVHYCDNETIQGVEFQGPPDVPDGTVLIADMSSNFLSKPVDVAKYGVIYAGAQKNVGPAGVTIVIVRKDLVGAARPDTPAILDWKTMEGSMYNTPPCWAIYMCGLVFAYALKNGGLAAAAEKAAAKASVVYDAIDGSAGFYASPVDPAVRSKMNVPFTIPSDAALEKSFVSEAAAAGMVQLKGHRSVGGMRASIYNAMPAAGVDKLAAFMKEFAAKHAATA